MKELNRVDQNDQNQDREYQQELASVYSYLIRKENKDILWRKEQRINER